MEQAREVLCCSERFTRIQLLSTATFTGKTVARIRIAPRVTNNCERRSVSDPEKHLSEMSFRTRSAESA